MKPIKIIKEDKNVDSVLFIIAWTMFVTSLIMQSSVLTLEYKELELALKAVRYMAYAVCCVSILCKIIRREQYILLMAIVAIFVNCYLQAHNATMPLYSLILLATIGISSELVLKTTVYTQGIVLATIIILSQLGIIQDYLFGDNTRLRHGLGFTWTTTGAILFFYLLMSIIAMHKSRMNIIFIIAMLAINYWLYKMTDSKMSFYLSTLMLLFYLAQSINPRRWKILSIFKPLYIALPFIMEIIAVIMFSSYKPTPLWNKLDKLLSGRLVLGHDAIEEYGFTLFGQYIEWIGYSIERPNKQTAVGYNYVESSYLQLTLNYGIIFMLIVLTIYSVAIYKAIKADHYNLVIIYVIIMVFSMTEPRLMDFAYNPFSLLAFSKMSKNENDSQHLFKRKLRFYNE